GRAGQPPPRPAQSVQRSVRPVLMGDGPGRLTVSRQVRDRKCVDHLPCPPATRPPTWLHWDASGGFAVTVLPGPVRSSRPNSVSGYWSKRRCGSAMTQSGDVAFQGVLRPQRIVTEIGGGLAPPHISCSALHEPGEVGGRDRAVDVAERPLVLHLPRGPDEVRHRVAV